MTATKNSSRRRLSDEERAEKRAAERELMAAAIEQLRSSEGWRRWLEVRRHFHSYSFHNQLLIAHQRPGATRVAGFKRWLALGYCVRKGERGIRIWAPCPPSKKALVKWREEGSEASAPPRTYFRLAAVFDRSQVEALPEFPGRPLDLDPPIEPVAGAGLGALFEPLRAFATSLGISVDVEPIPGSASGFYAAAARRIVLTPISSEYSANAQVKTLIHEEAHALLRCEREGEDPDLSYGEEEVVVECVAYTVCSTLGLDTAGFSIPYAASWGEGNEIERFAALIDRLAGRLEEVALATVEEPDRDGELATVH